LGTFPNRPNFLQTTSHITLKNLLTDIDEVLMVELGYSIPFSIYGSSTGASLALEVAKRIKKTDLLNNVILDSPFFASDKEFENGFDVNGVFLAKYAKDTGHGDVFNNFLRHMPQEINNNWQDMAEYAYWHIHNGNSSLIKDFVKLHTLAIVSSDKVDKAFSDIDKAVKYNPEQITAHALSLIHYIANAGYVSHSNGAIEGINDDLFNKIHITCGTNDIVAPLSCGVDKLVRRDSSISNRIIKDDGGHNHWKIRSKNVRQITDSLVI
jgi:pimeloyl-ACP methyl ester carboxylesterase